ncbi:MAG: DUF2807 domain-containing protein [Pseudomonadota bacterium]
MLMIIVPPLFSALIAIQSADTPRLDGGQSDRSEPARVSVTDFAGEIRIQSGPQLRARVERPDTAVELVIEQSAGGISIDGGRNLRRLGCYGGLNEARVGPNRREAEPFSALPLLIITSPDPVALEIDDSIFRAEAGDLAALDLSASRCGDFAAADVDGPARIALSGSTDVVLGDVAEAARIAISGSGDVELGSARSLDARISGSGDVAAGEIYGPVNASHSGSGGLRSGDAASAEVRISGSADIELGDLVGALDVRISGAGDVSAGDVGALSAQTSGSGGVQVRDVDGRVEFSASGRGGLEAGRIGGLDARIGGSADIEAGAVDGPVTVSISGSGDVEIGGGRAEPFEVRLTSSGGVRFEGLAVNPQIQISGGGDVRVDAVEGAPSVRRTGSGRFEIAD